MGGELLFTNLNNSFETGCIHGIWHEKGEMCTVFLQLVAGYFPPDTGWFRYGGIRLDHARVAYYNRAAMTEVVYDDKLIYLFDDIFDGADLSSFLACCKILFSLKKRGKTIMVASTDHKVLTASTDFLHILSGGVFQATLRCGQYDLLDDVLKHVRQR